MTLSILLESAFNFAKKISALSKRNMTILLVTASTNFGGAEAYLAGLHRKLRQEGHHVKLACPSELMDKRSFREGLGDDVESVECLFSSASSIRGTLQFFKILRSLGKNSVCHLNLPAPFSWPMIHLPLVCRLSGVRVVTATEHLPRIPCRWPMRLLKKFMSAFLDMTIAVSESSKVHLQEYFWLNPSKLRVIHNGVAIPEHWDRSASRKALSIPESSFVVLMVASLLRRKGQSTLLHSIRLLLDEQPGSDVLTVFVGGGEDQARLEAECRSLGLESNVRFTGHQDEVSRYYAASDVFALPSEKEAFPLSVLEAMSFELPVVASTVDGIPEQIEDDQNGFLIAPGNAQRLAHLLGLMMKDPLLRARLGAEGRKRVIERFSDASSYSKTRDIWKDAVPDHES